MKRAIFRAHTILLAAIFTGLFAYYWWAVACATAEGPWWPVIPFSIIGLAEMALAVVVVRWAWTLE